MVNRAIQMTTIKELSEEDSRILAEIHAAHKKRQETFAGVELLFFLPLIAKLIGLEVSWFWALFPIAILISFIVIILGCCFWSVKMEGNSNEPAN